MGACGSVIPFQSEISSSGSVLSAPDPDVSCRPPSASLPWAGQADSSWLLPGRPVGVVLDQVADERKQGVGSVPVLALAAQGLVDCPEP